MAAKIKKEDNVMIMAGKDRGKTGKVVAVLTKKNRVVVEGLNMVKKHQKPAPNREGGIVDMEAPVHMSNVMIVDPSDNKPTRVGFEVRDGQKLRVSRRTGTVLD
jgi:large subunit ribosomal protein L24